MLLNIPEEHEEVVSRIMEAITEVDSKDIRGMCFVLLLKDGGYSFVFNKTKATDLFAIAGYVMHKAGESVFEDKYPDIFTFTDKKEFNEQEE